MAKPKGSPIISVGSTSITLPHPDSGGRSDRWKVEREDAYTNLDGKLLCDNRKHRYTGDYGFSIVPYADSETIKRWYNQITLVQWQPWSDLSTITYGCFITKFVMEEGGVSGLYYMVLKIESVDLISEIPETDLVYKGRLLYQSAGTA